MDTFFNGAIEGNERSIQKSWHIISGWGQISWLSLCLYHSLIPPAEAKRSTSILGFHIRSGLNLSI